jgi:uncharacterized protein (TIGR03437 family)
VTSSVVKLNGAALATTYVSPTQLEATIPSTLLTKEDTLTITVQNPPPGGGGSNGVKLAAK